MELLVIILVLVYSVWSEVAKKKQEENVDIDFSELASLDDFFKDTSSQTVSSTAASLGSQTKPHKQRSRKRYASGKNDAGYDNAQSFSDRDSDESKKKSAKQKNYDELPSLSGSVNYDRMPGNDESSYDLSEEARKMFSHEQKSELNTQTQIKPIQISFDRESVVKAFVMSEVLQRYDLNRIYSRIPDFNQED